MEPREAIEVARAALFGLAAKIDGLSPNSARRMREAASELLCLLAVPPLAGAELELVARLLARELAALEAEAERVRRVDPRDAYDAENEADGLRPVLERVRALLGGET